MPSNYSAEQWELYTCSMNCNEAAKALNIALDTALKIHIPKLAGIATRQQIAVSIMDDVGEVMSEYSRYGAYDTEPRAFLRSILYKKIGDDINIW